MSEGFNISIKESEIASAVNKAILDQLDGPARERILADAIKHLTTAPIRSAHMYGTPKSPLQDAFDEAMQREVRNIAVDYLAAHDEFRVACEKLLDQIATDTIQQSDRLKLAATRALVEVIQSEMPKGF